MDAHHIAILTRSYVRNAIRSGGGLVFFLLFLVTGLIIAAVILEPVRHLDALAAKPAGALAALMEGVAPVVSWWIGAEGAGDPRVVHLLQHRPALLSAVMLVFIAFVPVVMCFAGFNQTAGDIGSRGLRYLIVRTRRTNIVVARLIGVTLFTALVSLLLVLLIGVLIAAQFPLYSPADLALAGLQFWYALVVFSLPYLCLTAWLSASLDSPAASLVLSLSVAVFSFVSIKALRAFREVPPWLDRLTPWGWKYDLFHPSWTEVALATAVLLGMAALFLVLAVRTFARRDL